MLNKQIIVVKLGGSVLGQLHPSFYKTCTTLIKQNIWPIVVHGGGAAITHWMKRIGKESHFIAGRRVTDEESLAIVTSVLGGQINKQLVSTFTNHAVPAIGISGIDLGLLSVKPLDAQLGYVGEVIKVEIQAITYLIEQGWVPIIASLGVDEMGQHYNVNADEAAAAIAQAVGAQKLLMVSDVDGVLNREGKVIPRVNATLAQHYIHSGEITGGMIPKVLSGIDCLQNAVGEVIILNGKKAWHPHVEQLSGTHLVKEGAESDDFVSKLSTI